MTAFGAGTGIVLEKLIELYNPFNLNILVAEWDDIAVSFIDWLKIASKYEEAGKQLTLSTSE